MVADQDAVPYVAQNQQEIKELIQTLNSHLKKSTNGKKTFSCKKTAFPVDNSPDGLAVDSWRLQDWDYKLPDLPTYARGLFTYETADGKSEIATRGYDKFFNIDEVNATKWRNIEQFTKGPYELSLKENGCIIFISGLSDNSLLICSKHSTGARSDTETSHAQAGDRWIDKQLKALGKTRVELAQELRSRNATAVCELCDDDFEEHILAYKGDAAGLYLHGININIPEFTTYPGAQVQKFADDWGFKKVDFLVKDDIATVKSFLDGVAETGSYNGRDVEGFVIRCKSNMGTTYYRDWFFKHKFDEPYLMYRQWRECTKALIANRPPKYKKHVKITEEYLKFARQRFAQDKSLAPAYNKNHGIIELRDEFLKHKNLKGSDIIRMEYESSGGAPAEVTRDVILVPIATIGCGKTTLSVALQHLFGWGHVQNDNITGTKRPPRFTKQVLEQLDEKPVVIADRNNAQRRERKQLLTDVHTTHLTAKLVAMNFAHDPASIEKIRQVTRSRVIARGDNHQTIQAASEQGKVIGIMEGFINRYEPLNAQEDPDDGFEAVIDLDPTAESRDNLEKLVSKLYELYPKLFPETMPTSEDLDNAINFALSGYKPDLRHNLGSKPAKAPNAPNGQQPAQTKKVKPKPLEYIAVHVPPKSVLDALNKTFDSLAPERGAFFKQLKQNGRIQKEFHVTLIHRASAKTAPELWQKYKVMHDSAEASSASKAVNGQREASPASRVTLGECKVQLERVVWDDRLMTIVVRLVTEGWETVNSVAHITVGTKDDSVKPKESNDLLTKWLEIGSGPDRGIDEAVITGAVLDGTVGGVLARH
jgi:tRNA ligase